MATSRTTLAWFTVTIYSWNENSVFVMRNRKKLSYTSLSFSSSSSSLSCLSSPSSSSGVFTNTVCQDSCKMCLSVPVSIFFKNASYNKALLKQIQSYIIFPVVDFQCTCIWFVWTLREMLDIFCLCTFFIFIFTYHYIFSFISSVFFLFFSVVDHCSQYQSMESLLRCLCSLILHTGVYVLSQSPMFSPRERQCVLASVIKI